jgi:hypothetical protein
MENASPTGENASALGRNGGVCVNLTARRGALMKRKHDDIQSPLARSIANSLANAAASDTTPTNSALTSLEETTYTAPTTLANLSNGASLSDGANASKQAVPRLSPDASINFASLACPMSIGADPVARTIAKPFAIRAIDIIIQENYLRDPDSPFLQDLKRPKLTKRCCGIYTTDDKAGSSSNMSQRYDYYYANEGLTEEQFCIAVNYDMVSLAVDGQMQDVYHDFMIAMTDSNNGLSQCQRDLFSMIRNRGGECLGFKKKIFLQLIEIGLQLLRKLGCPAEMLMFDRTNYQHWTTTARTASDSIIAELQSMPGFGTPDFYCEAVSSYATSYVYFSADRADMTDYFDHVDNIVEGDDAENGNDDNDEDDNSGINEESIPSFLPCLSSNVVATECILGSNNRTDTVAVPARPGCRNPTDGFSNEYTDEQKRKGRGDVLFPKLQGLKKRGGLMALDTNKYILQEDPNFGQ